MLHLLIYKSTRQNSRGFTLVELLAVIIIVGILCAIAIPSLLAMQGVAKLNSSADNVRTALETSQFQSIKKNTICTVYIPNGSQIDGTCLPLVNLDSGITVTTNLTGTPPQQVVYNSKGLTQSNLTIILSSNETGDKRCLVVNKGVGLIRGGKYVQANTPPCEVTE